MVKRKKTAETNAGETLILMEKAKHLIVFGEG